MTNELCLRHQSTEKAGAMLPVLFPLSRRRIKIILISFLMYIHNFSGLFNQLMLFSSMRQDACFYQITFLGLEIMAQNSLDVAVETALLEQNTW